MSVLRLDDMLAEVMERTADSGMRMIGVDGPSGSGKSTLLRGFRPASARHQTRWMTSFLGWTSSVGGHVLKPRSSTRCCRATIRISGSRLGKRKVRNLAQWLEDCRMVPR